MIAGSILGEESAGQTAKTQQWSNATEMLTGVSLVRADLLAWPSKVLIASNSMFTVAFHGPTSLPKNVLNIWQR